MFIGTFPSEFGNYYVLRRIGGGATADVYLAQQPPLQRKTALKILKQRLAEDEINVQRFIREAQAIAALNHPNLVQIYQIDCLDGNWYIAQEFVEGENLQQRIQRTGALPIPDAVDILRSLSSALDKAARSGIVHRDIKPENILLGSSGDIKITDFGLARIGQKMPDITAAALTEIGMTLGTPLYMSPEQAQGKQLDHRSDMYSLGITVYYALTGQLPFVGDTPIAVAMQHVNAKAQPVRDLRPNVPSALAQIVERMMAKEPERRYETFADIVTLLDDFKMREVPEKIRRPFVRQRFKDVCKRMFRFPFFFAACAAAVILGAAFGYVYQSFQTPAPPVPAADGVPKRDTVENQWIYACFVNTPEAWQSVIDYFPDEEYLWGYKAKRQLIRYYFYNNDSVSPLPLFQEFAELSDADMENQRLGLAGLAWCGAENLTDMKTASEFLNRVYSTGVLYNDPLFLQILDAASKTINRKKEH
ncbi:MAG: serine/threonine protein kinase, partial [Planctomycetaceae bacterium]|nr:serine/threonine protein kinase [Planctomycetaceae bacterium]